MRKFRGYGLCIIAVYFLGTMWVASYCKHVGYAGEWWMFPAFVTGITAAFALAYLIDVPN